MKQIQFDLDFNVDGKTTVCGFKTMHDDKGKYVIMCATAGDYTHEYELRRDSEEAECGFKFVTPDVPEDLKKRECEISDAILKRLEEEQEGNTKGTP